MGTSRVLNTISIYSQGGKDGIVHGADKGEAASSTWKAGAPLTYVDATSRYIQVWAGGTDTSKIIGIAAKDATGTTGESVPYYEANDSNVFAASVVNANDTAAYVLLDDDIGTAYSLVVSTTKSLEWYVDKADTSATKVEIIKAIDPVGDTNARVAIRFIGSMQAQVLQ